jgi:hypothetical protein
VPTNDDASVTDAALRSQVVLRVVLASAVHIASRSLAILDTTGSTLPSTSMLIRSIIAFSLEIATLVVAESVHVHVHALDHRC